MKWKQKEGKMEKAEVINILRNEQTCVKAAGTCDRDCGSCPLVKPTEDILEAYETAIRMLESSSAQPEIIHCRDCKHWRQQTNYAGAQLSFGFCESDDMWRSLYGETYEVSHIDTDDDFYCGFAKRREE